MLLILKQREDSKNNILYVNKIKFYRFAKKLFATPTLTPFINNSFNKK